MIRPHLVTLPTLSPQRRLGSLIVHLTPAKQRIAAHAGMTGPL